MLWFGNRTCPVLLFVLKCFRVQVFGIQVECKRLTNFPTAYLVTQNAVKNITKRIRNLCLFDSAEIFADFQFWRIDVRTQALLRNGTIDSSARTSNSARFDGALLSVAVTLVLLLPNYLHLRLFENKKLTTEKWFHYIIYSA